MKAMLIEASVDAGFPAARNNGYWGGGFDRPSGRRRFP
jgi:hypothetical protein